MSAGNKSSKNTREKQSLRILFSPIGSSDPLTILGDGPMLHIVRHYKPDKVVLFLPPKAAELEKKDARNKNAIELLSKEQGRQTPEIVYEYSDSTEDHRYDFYIERFAEILNRLDTENPNSLIIVNVSSGIVSMDQALVAFDAFDSLGLRALQVERPPKNESASKSKDEPSDFDLEELWSSDPDRNDARRNRCVEVESAHFSDLIIRDNIRSLVNSYDYAAASYLAGQSKTFPDNAKKLIDGCVVREELDYVSAAEFFKGSEFAFDPSNRLQEYIWVLEVYILRRQWVDYLRAITPALFETFHNYIKNQLKIPDDAWLKCTRNNNTDTDEYRLDGEKIRDNESLCKALSGNSIQGNPFVSNGYFIRLIEALAPENDDRVRLMLQLRKLEEGARHPLAHTTCRAEKEKLEAAGGMTLEDSLEALFKLNNIKPGLYDRINQAIIEML